MPKPRTQVPSSTNATNETTSGSLKESTKAVTSPNRKKPIPEPRSAMKSPQITSPNQGDKFTQEDKLKNDSLGSSKSHNISSSSITKAIKSYLPEKPKSGQIIQPIPTSEFQSFRRSSKPAPAQTSVSKIESMSVGELPIVSSTRQQNKSQPLLQRHNAVTSSLSLASNNSTDLSSVKEVNQETIKVMTPAKEKSTSYLPEYVNTTPPAVPARNPSFFGRKNSTGKTQGDEQIQSSPSDGNRKFQTSEILQNTQQPSSRRFSGDYVSINSSESFDGSLAVTPMPYIGRRSSTESKTNNLSKEQKAVSRRSSNPLPPPPPPPLLSSNGSQVSSFPYYVSDVYQSDYTDKSGAMPPQHSSTINPTPLNYSELSAISNTNTSYHDSLYYPKGTGAPQAIKSVCSPPPSMIPNNPDLPPPFSPGTYNVHNMSQGKEKLTKNDSIKKL